jgi:hypothetical protein
VRSLWTTDQAVAEAATCIKYNKHNRRISMYLAGFESTITAVKRLYTYALDSKGTGIGDEIK